MGSYVNRQPKLTVAVGLLIVALSGGATLAQQPGSAAPPQQGNADQEREQLKRELAEAQRELEKAKAALKAEREKVERERARVRRALAERAQGDEAVARANDEETEESQESALGKLERAAKFVAQQRHRLTGEDKEEEVEEKEGNKSTKRHAKRAKDKEPHHGGERIVSVRLNLDILVMKRSEASPGASHKKGALPKKAGQEKQESASKEREAEESE